MQEREIGHTFAFEILKTEIGMIQDLPFEALKNGYILLPKKMLEELFGRKGREMSELEATLKLLVTVNYKDAVVVQPDGSAVTCRRGESVRSWQSWSELFGWDRCKTRRFFARLQRRGMVELLPQVYTLHLRVKDYDLWTGCRSGALKKMAENEDRDFTEFWNCYHDTTQMNKTSPGRARKEWARLTVDERRRATENIDVYYSHLENTKYCLQAVNYLSYKAFDNEYEY